MHEAVDTQKSIEPTHETLKVIGLFEEICRVVLESRIPGHVLTRTSAEVAWASSPSYRDILAAISPSLFDDSFVTDW